MDETTQTTESHAADALRREKREQFTQPARGGGRWAVPAAILVGLALAAGLAYYVFAGRSGEAGGPVAAAAVQAGAGEIRIPVADLANGQAKFLEHVPPAGGDPVRFFAVKGADGEYRAALDACEVCYHARQGYVQDGESMICNNCGKGFPVAQINEVTGGCHPIGLPRAVEGTDLVIPTADLEAIDGKHAAANPR